MKNHSANRLLPNRLLLFRALALAGALLAPSAAPAETVVAEPDAFLEYVEATGTQYVDTGVNAETGLKARIDFAWASGTISGNDWSLLDAAIDSSSSDKRTRFLMCHLYGGGGKPYFGYGLKQRKNPDGSFAFVGGRRYEIVTDMSDTNSLQLVQNGKSTFSATDLETFKTNGIVNLNLNLYVFACNLSGAAKWFGKGKLYEMKIFKKNATTGDFDLLRHYIPCTKDGRAGLYDKANGTISYSDGDNEFNAGPVLDKPLDFVKWIWSDGRQWFDTRVWGRSGIQSEIDLSVREYSGDHCILGVRQGNNRVYPAYQYEKQFRYAWGTMPSAGNTTVGHPTNDVSYYMDTRYVIRSDVRDGYQSVLVSKNGGNPTELHKSGVAYNTGEIAITNITLCLLACNNGGSYVYPSKALVYSTKIWDGDELLRDFVATNAEGAAYAGLYDTVSEHIFRQIGTAEFDLASQVGGVTNSLRGAVPAPTTRLEYVDSDERLDYVDLGVIGRDGVEMEAVMEWLKVPADGAFVGARTNRKNNSTGAAGVRFFPYHYWNSCHRLGYDSDLFQLNNDQHATANTKYHILTRLDSDQGYASFSTFADGTWGATVERTILPANGWDPPVDTELPMYLFAINLDGTPRYHGKIRLYRLKLRVKQANGEYELVRELVPAKDPATDAPVLWDRVGETYFRNAGKYLFAGGGEERPIEAPFVLVVQ